MCILWSTNIVIGELVVLLGGLNGERKQTQEVVVRDVITPLNAQSPNVLRCPSKFLVSSSIKPL